MRFVLSSEIRLVQIDDLSEDTCQLVAVPLGNILRLLRQSTGGVHLFDCVSAGADRVLAPCLPRPLGTTCPGATTPGGAARIVAACLAATPGGAGCLVAAWLVGTTPRGAGCLVAAWLVGTTPSGILHLMVLVAANTSGL